MLEPFVEAKTGRALNLSLAALVILATALVPSAMIGAVPLLFLGPALALALLIRGAGAWMAVHRERRAMSWTPRVSSWIFLAAGALLFALAGSIASLLAFLAFVALDAAAGIAHRPPKEERAAKPFPHRQVWTTVAAIAYAGLVVAFQIWMAPYFSFGTLLTWTLIALGFSVAIRIMIAGRKAGEAWLRAPVDHRRHERRVRAVEDPERTRALRVIEAFRARGDATPLLDLVRETALAAGLAEADAARMQERIMTSFARAGTNRDADLREALDEVDRLLSARAVDVRA